MQLDVVLRHARRFAAVCCGILLGVTQGVWAQSNTPPAVTVEPPDGIAGVGEDFAFAALATGTAPFAYQWNVNGSAIAGETNAVLLLTNLTGNADGVYTVTVSNIAGSVTSTNALLSVFATNEVRRLQTGRMQQTGSQVGVPILLRANGRESSVSFSLSFDTNHYANPVFLAADTNALLTISNLAGAIGLAETLPAGKTFPEGFPWLGLMRFDLVTNNSAMLGALAFTNNPNPLAAANSNGLALAISAWVQPNLVLQTARASLDKQSGLFLQKVVVSNPSDSDMWGVNLLALGLGKDSRTNAIRLYNASGSFSAFPLQDPVMAIENTCCGYSLDTPANCSLAAYLACGGGGSSVDFTLASGVTLPFGQITLLSPGQTMVMTSEFYVSDHSTVPQPQYSFSFSGSVLRSPPGVTTPLNVTRSLFDTNSMSFILQFPTRLGMHYYVQYGSTLADLSTNAQTAVPAVVGTGSAVQWIDDGPPKTTSPPGAGSRFYRVLEAQ